MKKLFLCGLVMSLIIITGCATVGKELVSDELSLISGDGYEIAINSIQIGATQFKDAGDTFKVSNSSDMIVKLEYSIANNTDRIIEVPPYIETEIITETNSGEFRIVQFSRVLGYYDNASSGTPSGLRDAKFAIEIEPNSIVTKDVIYITEKNSNVVAVVHQRNSTATLIELSETANSFIEKLIEIKQIYNLVGTGADWEIVKDDFEKASVEIDYEDYNGNSILLHSILKNNISVSEGLISYFDIDLEDIAVEKAGLFFPYNTTIFHAAGGSANIDTINYLITKGFEINSLDSDGNHILRFALEGGNIELLLNLIQNGADVKLARIKNAMGSIKLSTYAGNLGYSELADFLSTLE